MHHESLDDAMTALEEWSDGALELEELPPCAAFAASCAVETMEGFGQQAVRNAAVAHLGRFAFTGFMSHSSSNLIGR